ncbi:hypothetical protein Tco_0198781 [Tanacetum coccineum]
MMFKVNTEWKLQEEIFNGKDDDAKEIWEAIRTRFSGNENSKKMQKAVFKQQLEAFKISSSEGLENGYDRCPTITFISGSSGAEESTARMQINKIPADFADELAIPSFKKSEDGTANTDGKKKRAHSINIKKLRSKDESDGHADNRYGSVNWGGNIPKVEETIHATYASSSKQMSKCRLSWILSSDQSVDPPLRIPETIPKYQRCKATPKDNRKNWNAMMEKNKGQKMAREAEVKKQRVFNTGNGVAKPVWTNANRVNHSNKFLPRSVQLNAGSSTKDHDKPNVKGVGIDSMFDIDYLTDSMNYILVSLENQANPHAGTSKVTNSACTSQTLSFNASEEKDEDVELIVVPSTLRNTEEKAELRKSSTNSKKEEILTGTSTREKGFYSTDTSERNS